MTALVAQRKTVDRSGELLRFVRSTGGISSAQRARIAPTEQRSTPRRSHHAAAVISSQSGGAAAAGNGTAGVRSRREAWPLWFHLHPGQLSVTQSSGNAVLFGVPISRTGAATLVRSEHRQSVFPPRPRVVHIVADLRHR